MLHTVGDALSFSSEFEMLFYPYIDTGYAGCLNTFLTFFCFIIFFSAEPPSLTAQPTRKIFAELDRNVDIPCLATGTLHIYLLFYIV